MSTSRDGEGVKLFSSIQTTNKVTQNVYRSLLGTYLITYQLVPLVLSAANGVTSSLVPGLQRINRSYAYVGWPRIVLTTFFQKISIWILLSWALDLDKTTFDSDNQTNVRAKVECRKLWQNYYVQEIGRNLVKSEANLPNLARERIRQVAEIITGFGHFRSLTVTQLVASRVLTKTPTSNNSPIQDYQASLNIVQISEKNTQHIN